MSGFRPRNRPWDKSLKTFAPCHSQSHPPADFTPTYGFLELEISTTTTESRWGLGFDYIMLLFTLESIIILYIVPLYFYVNYIVSI